MSLYNIRNDIIIISYRVRKSYVSFHDGSFQIVPLKFKCYFINSTEQDYLKIQIKIQNITKILEIN